MTATYDDDKIIGLTKEEKPTRSLPPLIRRRTSRVTPVNTAGPAFPFMVVGPASAGGSGPGPSHTPSMPSQETTWNVLGPSCVIIVPLSAPSPVIRTSADWRVHDVDGDGDITFYDLSQRPVTGLPSPHRGEARGTRLEMSVRFDQGAGNEFQGDAFDLTVVFTLKPK